MVSRDFRWNDALLTKKLSDLLFMKSEDELTGIEFLAELDRDEKMFLDGECLKRS